MQSQFEPRMLQFHGMHLGPLGHQDASQSKYYLGIVLTVSVPSSKHLSKDMSALRYVSQHPLKTY